MPRLLALFGFLFLFTWDASAQTVLIPPADTMIVCGLDEDGKKTGYWVFYARDKKNLQGYPADAIYEEGYYEKNRKKGIWIRYYPNGNKKTEITYLNGRPNGPYTKYYEGGQLEEKGVWSRNRYAKKFERYYRSGCLEQEATFDGSGNATSRIYYQDNCAITERKIRGSVIAKSVDGVQVKKDSLGRKQGYWKEYERYDGAGVTAEGEYVNGKKNGLWTGWYSKTRKCYEISFNMGVPDGWYLTYDPSGMKREQILRSDDGKSWVYYFYLRDNSEPIFTYPISNLKKVAALPQTYNWGLDVPDGFVRVADQEGQIVQVGVYQGKKLKEGVHTPRWSGADPCVIWYKDFEIVDRRTDCDPAKIEPISPIVAPIGGSNGSYQKLYNENKEIWMDGQFKNGKLWTGKHYVYDKNGLLQRIEIFKNGQYIGDGVIRE